MQLKQVEIFGFKTFADKVDLLFSPGITAIVGPNGCGKTNILDSIRWVLGEQSSKILRSTRMEDVIYNGGQTIKPLNMAEVSLTFVNNKKILPIEYDEVTITRRLYRSGESEYFINKSECRLKDINELFMDTGIGSHVYSIIEQSQIDLILSNNPALRRMLFEEAAGIMKYKTRKRETLSKLEHTEQNLLRLCDIVEEVSKQADLLKSQANKAQKYLSYRDELKDMQKRLTLLEYIDINELSKTYSSALKEQEEKKNNIQVEVNQKETEINTLKVEIIGIDRKIAEEHESQFKLEHDIDKLENAIAVDKERLGGLDNQKNREIENRVLYEDRIHRNSQELSETKNEIIHIKNDIESKTLILNEMEINLRELKNQLKDNEKSWEEYRNSEIDIKKKIASNENILQNHSAKAEEIVNSKQKIKNEKQELIKNINLLEDKINKEEHEISEIQKEKEKTYQNLTSQTQELGKSKNELSIKEKLIYEKFGDKREKESRLITLKSLKESMVGYFFGVKEILLEKKKGNFKGCIGPVADLIRTSQKYEYAIEVALGANIQNIVTETARDAKEAIEYLKNNEKGRATFLPLDVIVSSENGKDINDSVLQHEGVIGKAIDLIEFGPKYINIMKYLLGKVIIVRNLDYAIEILNTIRDRNFRLVTLNGEMINPAGAITGGSVDKRISGLLGREREMDELVKAVNNLEAELQKELKLSDTLKEKISALESSILELNKKYREKEIVLLEKNNLQVRYKEEKDSTLNHTYELEKLWEKIEQESKLSFNEKITSEKEIFELESTLREIIAKIDELVKTIELARKRQEELQNELTEIKLAIATKQEKLMHLENIEKNLDKSLNEIHAAIDKFAFNLKKFDEEKIMYENGIKEKEKEIIELFDKKKLKGQEITIVEEKHREINDNIIKIENELKECRKNYDKLQQEWYELEVKNQEMQLKTKNILEKLRTDFGIYEADLDKIEIQGEIDRDGLKEKIELIHNRMIKMEPVNVMAIEEYKNVNERYEFLLNQKKDLEEAKDSLKKTIDKINQTSESNFKETFELIKNNFIYVFKKFFQGGTADLVLVEGPEDVEPGIDIIAQPPGKKPQTITLLSGGERALTAIALIFGIFMVKPSPFCILDEVDAPLDDTNINKYLSQIHEFSANSQFITITHNKITMEKADTLYGVTMEEPGISKIMSIRFKEPDIN